MLSHVKGLKQSVTPYFIVADALIIHSHIYLAKKPTPPDLTVCNSRTGQFGSKATEKCPTAPNGQSATVPYHVWIPRSSSMFVFFLNHFSARYVNCSIRCQVEAFRLIKRMVPLLLSEHCTLSPLFWSYFFSFGFQIILDLFFLNPWHLKFSWLCCSITLHPYTQLQTQLCSIYTDVDVAAQTFELFRIMTCTVYDFLPDLNLPHAMRVIMRNDRTEICSWSQCSQDSSRWKMLSPFYRGFIMCSQSTSKWFRKCLRRKSCSRRASASPVVFWGRGILWRI